MQKTVLAVCISILSACYALPAFAAGCSVTYSFSNGTTADASQVNQNFSDLANCAAPAASPTITGVAAFSGRVSLTAPGNSRFLEAAPASSGTGYVEMRATSTGGDILWGLEDSTGGSRVSGSSAYAGLFGTANLTPLQLFTNDVVRATIGTDGSLLLGTTTNGGWTGSSKVEAKVASTNALSGYATAAGGTAFLARIDNTSGVWLDFRYTTSSMGQFSTDATSIYWIATNSAKVISGGTGGVQLVSGATSWSAISDERLKNWSVPQDNYARSIRDLWVGDYDLFKSFAKTGPARSMFGVRAQQAYSVLPADLRDMAVHKGANDNEPWTVSSEPFAYLALWGVKDLYAKFDSQAQTVSAFQNDIAGLRAELASFKKLHESDAAELAELKASVSELRQALRVRTARN